MFFSRTDLACDSIPKNLKCGDFGGVRLESKQTSGVEIIKMSIITEQGAKITKRPIGEYTTIYCGRAWLYEQEYVKEIEGVLSSEINKLLTVDGIKSILICGLGNKNVTVDALGPLVIDKLLPTGSSSYNARKSFLIAPGVQAQSGIEAYDAVLATSKITNADAVIVIDALSSKSLDRLCTTIQISNSGILPGSGIGNSKKEISKSTIGIPVISVGVPTVIDSSTLIYETINEANIDISNELEEILSNNRNFFVAPKDIDIIVSSLSSIIANALNSVIEHKN